RAAPVQGRTACPAARPLDLDMLSWTCCPARGPARDTADTEGEGWCVVVVLAGALAAFLADCRSDRPAKARRFAAEPRWGRRKARGLLPPRTPPWACQGPSWASRPSCPRRCRHHDGH